MYSSGKIRPPPPAFAMTAEYKERNATTAQDAFVKHVCMKAAEVRDVPAAQMEAAFKADGGTPAAAVASLVPEVPWHRAVFVSRPRKGSDRIPLSVFFSNGRNGKPEVMSTALWDGFRGGADSFAVFKVEGIRGADDRLFCMFACADAMFGVGRMRIVVPQKESHIVVMQLVDYILASNG